MEICGWRKGWGGGGARGEELTGQQINEQSPTSLKVISQLSIDCHQVTPIYNCASPASCRLSWPGAVLCSSPSRAQSTEPALSQCREGGLRVLHPPDPPALFPSKPHISGFPGPLLLLAQTPRTPLPRPPPPRSPNPSSSESIKNPQAVTRGLSCPRPGCSLFPPTAKISRLCSYIKATPLANAPST